MNSSVETPSLESAADIERVSEQRGNIFLRISFAVSYLSSRWIFFPLRETSG